MIRAISFGNPFKPTGPIELIAAVVTATAGADVALFLGSVQTEENVLIAVSGSAGAEVAVVQVHFPSVGQRIRLNRGTEVSITANATATLYLRDQ